MRSEGKATTLIARRGLWECQPTTPDVALGLSADEMR